MLFSTGMKSISLRAVFMLLVTVALFNITKGQVSESQYWSPVELFRIEVDRKDPEVRELLERWDRIGNEAQGVTNGPAGTYLKFGYNGWLLRWAPRAGFVYVYHSEGLSIIDFSYGRVEVTSNAIRFIPERDMKETFRNRNLSTPLTWVAAKSPQLKFMIPKEEMPDFGQYIAGMRDYNDFNGPCCEFSPFFFSPVATGKLAQGVSVPDEYQRFMRPPITGLVVSIGKRRIVKDYGLDGKLYSALRPASSLTPITLNIGRIHGLRKNMLLRFVGEQFDLPSQYVRITSVAKQTAVAVVIRTIDKRNQESYLDDSPKSDKRINFPPIRAGMRVTTSAILNN
jgi:hypothetical protein